MGMKCVEDKKSEAANLELRLVKGQARLNVY